MKYEVRYDPKCEKQLKKLPKEISIRIIKHMRKVSETGRGIEPIEDKRYGYKIKIGDYRVLIDLSYKPNTIWVRYIDHRRRIYKRLK